MVLVLLPGPHPVPVPRTETFALWRVEGRASRAGAGRIGKTDFQDFVHYRFWWMPLRPITSEARC